MKSYFDVCHNTNLEEVRSEISALDKKQLKKVCKEAGIYPCKTTEETVDYLVNVIKSRQSYRQRWSEALNEALGGKGWYGK